MSSRVRFNRHTLALGAMVVAMWYAGAAQANGAAYLLAFLTGTVAAVSYVHARQNLRGLEVVRAGSVRAVQAGEWLRLPLELRSLAAQAPSGLEISAPGAAEAVFIEQVPAGESVRVTLRLKTTLSGQRPTVTVVVRSHFPLGLFTCERWLEIPAAQVVHPRPSGNLPLPVPEARSHAAKRPAAAGHRGATGRDAGDDFAGVRSWQAGDSLRHVDWKALARGRPLMVKQWAAVVGDVVWLDWNRVELAEEEKAGQIAEWIRQCEGAGVPYGLRLPDGTALPPSLGVAHQRQCLDALAAMNPEPIEAQSAQGRRALNLPRSLEVSPPVSAPALYFICAALALAGLPMIGRVSSFGVSVFFLCLLWRCGIAWRGHRRLPGLVVRLVMVALVATGIYVQQGTLLGVEAGIGLAMALIAGKALETRTPRDLQVLALLGWFLCLCSLVLEQNLARALAVLGAYFLIVLAVIRFRRGASGWRRPVRVAMTLALQALPLILLLFFFFPRGSGGLVTALSRRFVSQSGLSSRLDPGSVARVAESYQVAFHAEIEPDAMPRQTELYWRCLVLWECNGLSWARGGRLSMPTRPRRVPGDVEVAQTITLEPHGDFWLAALDRPRRVTAGIRDYFFDFDGSMWSTQSVDSLLRYRVVSLIETPTEPEPLPADHRRAALQLPTRVSPSVRELAESFRGQGRSAQQIKEAAIKYLRDQRFEYSLEPGDYPGDGLEEFLLRRKVGFCEHFSASFATLMRLAGVPARVVVGYVGGEPNESGGYLIVRQSDAHAWTEIWLDDEGWTRVDPTAELVPERLTTDLQTLLGGGLDGVIAARRQTWWWQAYQTLRLAWDNVNYKWYSNVVRYEQDEQRSLLDRMGLKDWRRLVVVPVLAGLVLLGLVVVALWVRRPARHPDPAVRLWQDLCRHLSRRGVTRRPSEGPIAFSERAAASLPELAVPILEFGRTYASLRYGDGGQGTPEALREKLRAIVRRNTTSGGQVKSR